MKKKLSVLLLCVAGLCLTAIACRVKSPQSAEGEVKAKSEMKTLIVYFSYTAGNTKRIAEKIQKETGGDIVRLEPVQPYSDNYRAVVSQGQKEVESGYKPDLKPLGVDVGEYDRIIVGSPTWWYRMAPAVLSFLSAHDFSGKTVVPFSTHAGWPGSVIEDMTAEAEKRGARVENGHSFKFSSNEEHFDRMETPETELDEWIESIR